MHFLSVTADALNPDVIQRDQINDLISQLYEAESRANKQEGLKEKFERVRPLPQTRRAVNSLLCRKSGSFGKTSRKRYGRKRKLLPDSKSNRRWVHAVSSVRHALTSSNRKDRFDVGEFLRGGLGEVPSKPNHRASNLDEVRRMKAVSWG